MIFKALLLLVIEIITEYFIGTMLVKAVLKRDDSPGMNLLVGFIADQVLFQVFCLAVTQVTGVLHHLTIIWGVMRLAVLLFSIIIGRDIARKQWFEYAAVIKAHKIITITAILVIMAFCWYASINGERNDDADYYIALMTTTLDTDTLFKYNAYTGIELDSLYLRRALVTFEVQGAVLSQLAGIHPLVTARVFRACQNVLLTSAAVLLCANTLFWRKEKDRAEHSLLTLIIFWILQPPFANTIYTPAAFLLYRAYEAKAFTANLIVLFGIYLCVQVLRERNGRYLLIIGMFLWGSLALSTSAFVVAFAECGILLVPVWLQRKIRNKKQEKIHAS